MSLLAAVLFHLFAALTLLGAVGVVVIKSPMRAAVSLLATFLGVAALFFLNHAEFLGAVQLLVYAGGILVLFLFGIMFTSGRDFPRVRRWRRTWPLAAVIGILFAVSLIYLVGAAALWPGGKTDMLTYAGGNTESVGVFLYSNYLVPFEVASLFLLVAMVGAILLGRGEEQR